MYGNSTCGRLAYASSQYRSFWANLCVANERVLTTAGLRPTVVFQEGRIASVENTVPDGIDVEDLGDALLMGGLVDSHVHVNEPGRTEWKVGKPRPCRSQGRKRLVDMPLNNSR